MKYFKYLILLIVLIGSGVSAAESLVIYSGRHAKFLKPVMAEFEKQTGIKVTLHNAKASALINRMRLEKSKTKADAFISNDAGSLQIGSDIGLFQAMDKGLLTKIEKNYKAKDNTWVGLSARARVLVVNKASLKELDFVKSVFDLADKRLKGKLAITHSANGSFLSGITVYVKVAGKEKTLKFMKGIKINSEGKVFRKHSKIVKAVAAGKKSIGLVNHYYIYRHLAKNPNAPIQILLPDQANGQMGVAWNITGIAISKHTKKKETVEKLIKFLVSKKGQSLFANQNREYPIRVDVKASPEIPARDKMNVADVPMSLLGKDHSKTLNLIEKAGLY